LVPRAFRDGEFGAAQGGTLAEDDAPRPSPPWGAASPRSTSSDRRFRGRLGNDTVFFSTPVLARPEWPSRAWPARPQRVSTGILSTNRLSRRPSSSTHAPRPCQDFLCWIDFRPGARRPVSGLFRAGSRSRRAPRPCPFGELGSNFHSRPGRKKKIHEPFPLDGPHHSVRRFQSNGGPPLLRTPRWSVAGRQWGWADPENFASAGRGTWRCPCTASCPGPPRRPVYAGLVPAVRPNRPQTG